MVSFLCNYKPRSVQAKDTSKYKEAIRSSFQEYYPVFPTKLDSDLYALVYYFHKDKTELDADNLSKPVLDALETLVYDDDKVVKLRRSGVYHVSKEGTAFTLDFGDFSEPVSERLIEMWGEKEHIIYVEIGRLDSNMFEIGLESK